MRLLTSQLSGDVDKLYRYSRTVGRPKYKILLTKVIEIKSTVRHLKNVNSTRVNIVKIRDFLVVPVSGLQSPPLPKFK